MQTVFPPEKLRRYPHMLPADIEIWERFLTLYAGDFLGFQYDVHVGKGIPIDPSWPDRIKKMAQAVTQKRIDAIGLKENEIWIFEVKPDAGLSAFGQILAYGTLYQETFHPDKPVTLCVVSDNIDPDTRHLFALHNIKYYIV